MKSRRFLSTVILCLLLPAATQAELKVNGFFTSHMVIQRGKPIQVWGTGDPGAEINVSLAREKATAKADNNGFWQASLAPMQAGGPFDLKVASGSGTSDFTDIMIGDVWLIAGQSNVVLGLQSTTEWPEVKTAGVFPAIRVCRLPSNYAFEPADNYKRPYKWEVLDSAREGFLSGVGYHFARTIQPAIGVTLGLIQGSSGGTQIEQWTPQENLKTAVPNSPSFAARDKAQAALAADPNAKVSALTAGASALYNGTIAPIRFAKLAGVVWYQGEANTHVKADYRLLLKTLVESWRGVFKEDDLPFVIVQLPNFGLARGDLWMRVREAQMLAARDLGLGLAVTIDQGSKTTIHPPNKAEVGRRAGVAALQHVYKQNIDGSSPMAKTVQFSGSSAVVTFDGFKGDLVVHGNNIEGFELAGADKVFHPATAKLSGRAVTLQAEGVTQPKAVRYLWANCPDAVTLFSVAGLPAAPFRSDGWPETDASPWFSEAAK